MSPTAVTATPPPASAPVKTADTPVFPARYADLKRRILKKEDEEAVIKAWNELLVELAKVTQEFIEVGTPLIPSVEFSEIGKLSAEQIDNIKRRGSVHIKNVVDDEDALRWKELLREYVRANPSVEGFPKENKQFFEIYWSKSQLEARSHPNVLAAQKWLNSLYHSKGAVTSPVSLSTPLSYADRFRIREPSSFQWTAHPPHIDGGSVERWEDDGFRKCFEDILKGDWRSHDPYDMDGRLNANTNIHGRPNQSSVFRSWQGWLAMSNTGPGEGTLRLFPDVLLSNSYLILRPFFRQVDPSSPTPLDPSNWVLDTTTTGFPGITPMGTAFSGQRLSEFTHPHMRVHETMISVHKVAPGDMVFWHCDVVHSVETEHHGKGDSSVMYIPAVPLTEQNAKYVVRQRDHFLKGLAGPDFPQAAGEVNFLKKGELEDVHEGDGKRAMALEPFEEVEGDALGTKEAIKIANSLILGTA